MIASLRKRVNALKKDREHGAGWLASQALDILREISSTNTASTSAKFLKDTGEVVAVLMETRPAMVSIANYAIQFKEELEATAPESKSTDNLKKRAAAIARRLLTHSETSSSQAARNAAKLIGRRTIVMTCSYSSTVCTTLDLARQKGTDFKVLIAESRSDKISYGQFTVERLIETGISCRTIPDDQIAWHAARANIILMGADSVSLQGWIINGFPSYVLATIAKRKKVPVYVVCATAKFDVRGFLAGFLKAESGFDTVPLELIKGIVTEKGILLPDDVYELAAGDIFRSNSAGPR